MTANEPILRITICHDGAVDCEGNMEGGAVLLEAAARAIAASIYAVEQVCLTAGMSPAAAAAQGQQVIDRASTLRRNGMRMADGGIIDVETK